MEIISNKNVWQNAPVQAWAWEKYPNGKCVWHCKDAHGNNYTESAPKFQIEKTTLWRDPEKQKWADSVKVSFPTL